MTERGFTIVRHFDVPPELVFRAWTDPTQLHWLAGHARPDRPSSVDLRVGGAWRVWLVEDSEEARSYVTGGLYHVIEAPRRLVFSWGAVDGWPLIDPDHPEEVPLVSVSFDEDGNGTSMVFELSLAEHLDHDAVRRWFDLGIRAGWQMTLDRLTVHDQSVHDQPEEQ